MADRKRLSLLWTLVLMLLGTQSFAAHLVGGELTYTCTGSNSYQIKLVVYRDCNSTGAQLDQTASIGIFDALSGQLIYNLQVNKGATLPLPANTGNPCLQAPPNVCTEYGHYMTIQNLPPRASGYIISYQRCCRNATITNINNPDDWGMTLTTQIPPNDSCNSSPQWDSFPPIVLCSQENLNIPVTCTDPDGDSLYYSLCGLYHGGGKGNGGGFTSPQPSPPAAPPYVTIPYKAPNTVANPIPGAPPLSMHPQLGALQGKITVLGQYVMAICVEEWRNGVLLNTIRRDYQFNVTSCQAAIWANIISEVDDPTQLCIGITVPFQEDSYNATFFHWDFGDPNSTTDTSNLPNPVYTFSDTGIYIVTLIANPGWPCADTDQVAFHIYPPINASMQWTGGICDDEQGFVFTAAGTWYADKTIEWTFGQPGDANIASFSGEFPPPVTFNQPGAYPITLYIKSKACEETIVDTLRVYQRPRIDANFDGIVGCQPFMYTFDPLSSASTELYYLWDFGDGDTSHAAMPTHRYTQPGLFDVTLWMWTVDGCIYTLMLQYPQAVLVNPRPASTFSISPTVTSIYTPLVTVSAQNFSFQEQYFFTMGDSTLYTQTDFFAHQYADTGNFEVLRISVNQFGCWDTLGLWVRINPVLNLWAPTAFTPNGDGTNDNFRPFVTGFNQYALSIVNRWGQEVFRSQDAREEWNGQLHNRSTECPQDVYSWRLFIIDFGDSPVEYNGTVILYR